MGRKLVIRSKNMPHATNETIKVSWIPEGYVLVIVEEGNNEDLEAIEAMEAQWEMWDEYYHCCGSY